MGVDLVGMGRLLLESCIWEPEMQENSFNLNRCGHLNNRSVVGKRFCWRVRILHLCRRPGGGNLWG